jgi:hypothetical protein
MRHLIRSRVKRGHSPDESRMLDLSTAAKAERLLDDPSETEKKLVSEKYTEVVLGQNLMR